ncbi:hypothetical protein [Vibrio sp. LaRot3]|uniref:hypothetical protein n=1 Tax=Vibrio sp. LaRot3 TaxID=2998829 RepID=UPI0022CE02C7|nr:hypothetical protein [Vibrio sp. LaRot3]MDA0148903.1 hypothetical protein [Vibrio sp. LaRot3]
MRSQFKLYACAFAVSVLLLLSIAKGLDDMAQLSLKNQLTEVKRNTVKHGYTDAKLTHHYTPVSATPFDDSSTLALYFSWLAYQERSNTAESKMFSQRAQQLYTQQLRLRPLDASLAVQRANEKWRSGGTFSSALDDFHLAQKLGHYEQFTLLNTLTYFLSHWPQLSLDDKKTAIGYLLEHDKYAMKLWQYDALLQKPVVGERACSIFKFNGITPYFCRR